MLPVAGTVSAAVLLTLLGAVVALHGLRKMADRLTASENPPIHS